MKVQLLVDNPNSWILQYAQKLDKLINESEFGSSNLIFTHEEVGQGDVLCLLSCEKIFKNLSFNKYNLVVHESDLPEGKGWSPLTWQVLEGVNEIPITLFEAEESVDSGVIYSQTTIKLEGHELISEIKDQQGEKTIELIFNFLKQYPNVCGRKQEGIGSFYPRRRSEDSLLDINKSINDQFNLLRVCDNERYPAYFEKNGVKYLVKIIKDE
jgi:methionyl-tRNA formyltransferase